MKYASKVTGANVFGKSAIDGDSRLKRERRATFIPSSQAINAPKKLPNTSTVKNVASLVAYENANHAAAITSQRNLRSRTKIATHTTITIQKNAIKMSSRARHVN